MWIHFLIRWAKDSNEEDDHLPSLPVREGWVLLEKTRTATACSCRSKEETCFNCQITQPSSNVTDAFAQHTTTQLVKSRDFPWLFITHNKVWKRAQLRNHKHNLLSETTQKNILRKWIHRFVRSKSKETINWIMRKPRDSKWMDKHTISRDHETRSNEELKND